MAKIYICWAKIVTHAKNPIMHGPAFFKKKLSCDFEVKYDSVACSYKELHGSVTSEVGNLWTVIQRSNQFSWQHPRHYAESRFGF